jgi:hypothetical protein
VRAGAPNDESGKHRAPPAGATQAARKTATRPKRPARKRVA